MRRGEVDPDFLDLARELRRTTRLKPDLAAASGATGSGKPKAQFNLPDGSVGQVLAFVDDGSGNPIIQAVDISGIGGGPSYLYWTEDSAATDPEWLTYMGALLRM